MVVGLERRYKHFYSKALVVLLSEFVELVGVLSCKCDKVLIASLCYDILSHLVCVDKTVDIGERLLNVVYRGVDYSVRASQDFDDLCCSLVRHDRHSVCLNGKALLAESGLRLGCG